ncbi:CG2233 [Drosophila busckii]|uniref:CG2233 n=1 Tax=Drosophila busckii TaxID=30019 RepID=A0A0M4ETY6_DROBS|nr:uncharacterized protein LOC108607114 [Drosophila busckii]ALC49126.1 CG2233 [Drosophila busckii]
MKLMLFAFGVLVACCSSVSATCSLQLQDPVPIVVKHFGSKSAIIKKSINSVTLDLNETMTFHCPTGLCMQNRNYNNDLTKINAITAEFKCTNEGINIDGHTIDSNAYDTYIRCCSDYSQTIYESNSSLPGCDSDAMSLLIGYSVQDLQDVKLLGLCYELGASRVRFVSFLAYAPSNLLLESRIEHELSALNFDTNIGNLIKYFRYPSEDQFQQLLRENQKQLGDLFNPQLFEYNSLLQDEKQSKELASYKDMLSIVWLKQLRVGNWMHFINALRASSDAGAERYDVRLGVSGVAAMPSSPNCNNTAMLQLKSSDDLSLQIPAQIWAHVRTLEPTGEPSDEFVVVAHNSPYANIAELSSFCVDMCNEIPWLRNSLFGQLHLLPMYGVVHCCRIDQLDKLTDFPVSHLPPPPPPLPLTTTTTERTAPPLLLL